MAKYCLVYDAKDALGAGPMDLKLDIADFLLANKAFNLENPVNSTILFEDGNIKPTLAQWQSQLTRKFQEEIYYYLCVVASSREGEHLERNEGDMDLNDDFQEAIDDLEV
jgi:hypothetical protein